MVYTVLSEVLSIRIPKELKEKMKRYKIDWSDEIRRYLEDRVRSLELLEILEDLEERSRRRKTRVDSAGIIRVDRDER